MEGKSSESNLDNFYEYEQRSRAHTWPEQNFQQLHPISTDLISRTSSLASVFYTNVYSPMTVEHISNLIPRYDSGVSLATARESTLNLFASSTSYRDFQQYLPKNLYNSPRIPFRSYSDNLNIIQNTTCNAVKSDITSSYPLLSHLLNSSGQSSILSEDGNYQVCKATLQFNTSKEFDRSSTNVSNSFGNTTTCSDMKLANTFRKSLSELLPTTSISSAVSHFIRTSIPNLISDTKYIIESSTKAVQVINSLSSENVTNIVISSASATIIHSTSPTLTSQSLSTILSTNSNVTIPYYTHASQSPVMLNTPSTTLSNGFVDRKEVGDVDEVEVEEGEEKKEREGKKNEVKKEASTSTVIIEGTECHPEDPLQDETRKRSKRCTASGLKKANAWGEGSYSQLITQALNCAPNGRLKLSEIYTWFMCNIPYFGARSTPQLSSAWKNSIRHNLSLHNRFMRVQNEGAGKSSWWMINPDAKPGRNPRRQRSATLESTTKVAIDKKRRGARKKAMEIRARAVNSSLLHSGNNSIVSSQTSVVSRDLYVGEEDSPSFEPFRSRTQSNLSLPASTSRVSPSMMENYENFDSFDFPPFVEATGGMPHDILDRTNEMNLNQGDSPAFHRPMANPMLNGVSSPASSNLMGHLKADTSTRNENNVQPPPSYHELNVVRSVQNIQNPLLRTHLIQSRMPGQQGIPYGTSYSPSSGDVGVSSWMHSNMIPITIHPSISCSAQQPFSGNGSALPIDLENLALPDQPLMEVENMEAVLRHELSQSTGSQLSFDNI